MILSGKNKDFDEVLVICDCGCDEAIVIKKLDWHETEIADYYISLVAGKFSERQRGIFSILWTRLKTAWLMLRGKEYRLCEVVFSEQELKQLADELYNLVNKE